MNLSMDMTARLGADISGFQAAMNTVKSTMSDVGSKIGDLGGKLKGLDGKQITEFGNSMTSAGKKATLMAAPLAALGVASIKIGSDFQQSMANVSAISGATGADFSALEAKAREMGATTKFSASQSADALSYMAMAGWDTQQMLDGIPGVMNLAAASGADLAVTSDILTDAISAFGDKASDAGRYADVMAAASSAANTNVEMLGESFKYVAPVAGAMGYSLEDTSKALALMANNGIKASQGGTSLKNIMTNLANPTKAMKGAMDDLGISLTNSDGSMKSLDEVMGDLRHGFSGLSEEQKAQYAATLAGKEGMAGLLAIVGASDEDFNKLGNAINNSNGKAQEMADTMGNTVQGKFLAMKSALEEAGIVIFNILEPALRKVIDVVTQLAGWFQNLNPSIQVAILAIAGIAIAIGPVLVIMGTLISSVGTIITAFGAISGVLSVAGAAFTVLTGPVGLAIAGIAALGVGVYKMVKHFQKDAIEPVTRFGDEVSESTQKAVGAFMDMSEEADVALKELAWSQETVTAQMAEDMTTQQQAITDNLLAAIKDRHSQETQEATAQFEHIKGLNEEQKAHILENINTRFEEEAAVTQEGNARINEIFNQAKDEKRALTEQESSEILAIRQDMTKQAVSVMSESEVEQKLIYEKMKENGGKISALEAAEVVRNSKKKKDDVIKEANNQYDETYKWAIRQRDELGTMSAEEAQAVIDEAARKRDESVSSAEDMHKKVVKEAKNQAKEHVDEVNWETGEILTKWDKLKTDVSNKVRETALEVGKGFANAYKDARKWVTETATNVATKYSEIKKTITDKISEAKTALTTGVSDMATTAYKKFGEIVTSARDKFNEVKGKITQPIESAKTTISGIVSDITGFFSNMKLSIPKISMPKLPKFSLSGSFSLNPPSTPKIGVSWNAKGGIFNKPTIFNTANAGLQGVGEAGSEAILPLNSRTLAGIGKGVASNMSNTPSHRNNEQPEAIVINFNVDKMVANEHTARQLADMVSKQISNNLKRDRGMRR